MLLLISIAILFLIYAILVIYYGISFQNIPNRKAALQSKQPYFSIVIPARNEAIDLPVLLNSLEAQNYPRDHYEIILVDDHSTDETISVASKFALVKCISAGEAKSGAFKKQAIEDGIKAAKFDWIIGTDADCIPGPDWLNSFASIIKEKDPVFIAAPVQFISNNSILGIFQEMDFMILQAVTAVVVTKEQMSMCNGANIAYKKQAFYEVKGFEGIDHLASGDDMLLMYKIWKKYPGSVVYLKQEESIVRTKPPQNWKAFFQQRIRWASKAGSYQDKRILPVLILVYLFNLCFPLLLIASLIYSCYWKYFFILWLAKTLVEWPLFLGAAKFFKRRSLVPLFFFFQPLHIMYTLISGFLGQVGEYEWKGRKVS